MKYKKGDHVFFLDGKTIREMEIIRISNGRYVIRRTDKPAGLTVSESRLFGSEDELREAHGMESKNRLKPPRLH